MAAITASVPLAIAPNGQTRRGHFQAMRHDILGYLDYLSTQGDFLQISLPFTAAYFINHPDLIQEVMVKQSRRFHKPFPLKYTAQQFFGQNVFTSDGELWQLLRSTLQPAFHVQRLNEYAEIMVADTEAMLANWQPGQTVDVPAAVMDLTLGTTTQCFFGTDLRHSPVAAGLVRLIELFFLRISDALPIPAWLPLPGNWEFKRLIRERDRFFLPFIAERRAAGEDQGDVLSLLMRAQAADTTGLLTDYQVLNEVTNLFAAGFEVTAYTLAFTLYLLAQHPVVEARLRTELDEGLGQRSITVADLGALPYLEQVIQESMRLLPVAALLSRQAVEPVTLGGYTLPKNSLIFIAPWTLHRRADLFPDPLVFRPERFSTQTVEKFAYLPFSGGPRTCIGQAFALMQMRINLATLLQRFQLSLVPGYVFEPVFQFNTRPKQGLPMVVGDRHP